MALSTVFLSDLKAGRCSSAVKVRLFRFWEGRNLDQRELMCINMLLIDVNSTIMQASINANRVPVYWPKLAAGSMYSLSGFDFCRCAQEFMLSDSYLHELNASG
ncbi:unnamed protein product [Eruca vesicaria subsp. sativa]|uniref:Uncharacterized protein n=1 Tax=Eruca vesicaria subsp. sativa TaxID=29727 RepID=A0ABC8MAW3_ERUVS|nr:unnamed protein product [Eruca vesicaria subsp. sativa]